MLLLQYEEGSAPALALKATIERTEKRFANYAKAGLLCGTDGLPHLISDPGLALRYGHAGETLVSLSVFVLGSFRSCCVECRDPSHCREGEGGPDIFRIKLCGPVFTVAPGMPS